VRQLDRQISSQFHTRAMLSKNKQAVLQKASKAQPGDLVTAEEAIMGSIAPGPGQLRRDWQSHALKARMPYCDEPRCAPAMRKQARRG
jgi:predicted nuclease of restriction endonuclease-like (RecB) superfamily